MKAVTPEAVSFAEFARLQGCRRSYVTALKAAGRLVLTDDGRRVQVAASQARIAATADPSKAGVVERHAAARTASAPATRDREVDGEEFDPDGPTSVSSGFQHWKERNEKAKALGAERENAIADGKLLAADDVVSAVAGAVTTLRNRLESLADVIGPQLAAETDEARCRALIAEAVEHALAETARQFAALGKADGAA